MGIFTVKPFKEWHERVKPANNTLKTRITIYNRCIEPNFDTRMSITKFASMTDEIQKLINASSMGESMRKSLGSKRKQLRQDQSDAIVRMYGEFIESKDSKIFDTLQNNLGVG